MSFGKRGAAATRLSKRVKFATSAEAAGGVAIPPKSTMYDTKRQASMRADAAKDNADARLTRIAVISAVAIVGVLGLYSLMDLYFAAGSPKIAK